MAVFPFDEVLSGGGSGDGAIVVEDRRSDCAASDDLVDLAVRRGIIVLVIVSGAGGRELVLENGGAERREETVREEAKRGFGNGNENGIGRELETRKRRVYEHGRHWRRSGGGVKVMEEEDKGVDVVGIGELCLKENVFA